MVNKNKIKNLIDSAGSEYEKCWNMLCSIKSSKSTEKSAQGIIGFQSILGVALLKLGNQYLEIHKEKRKIIQKKGSLSPIWFRGRL